MSTKIYITYTDDARSAISSWFASPQDGLLDGPPENYGETTTGDPLWKSFFQEQPLSTQQYLPTPIA